MKFGSMTLVASMLVLSTGCYSTHYGGGTTAVSTRSHGSELLVVDTLHDETSLEAVLDEGFLHMVSNASATGLEGTGIASRTVAQQDIGTASTNDAFLVRYRLTGFEDRSRPGSRGVLAGLFCFPVVWFFIGALPAEKIELHATWEMRVFDIRGVAPTTMRDTDTGEIVSTFDTSALSPILRREYEVHLEGGMSGPDHRGDERRRRVVRETATEFANRLVEASSSDIARAIGNAGPAPVRGETQPATATQQAL